MKRTTVITLLLLLALSTGVLRFPASAEEGIPGETAIEATEEPFLISTAEDLISFSALCRMNNWSENRTVILQEDISLAGLRLEPIPSFSGIFRGNGHLISDLNLTTAVSPCGLFGRVEQGGQVLDLNVTGTCTPEGNADNVGGIAGINNGLIAGCSFTGTVGGNAMVGGIVGDNSSFGCVESCRSFGSVTGNSMTGGVAGRNAGTVQRCENASYVNITAVDPKINLNDLDIVALLESFTLASTDTLGVTEDTGGIAGYSSGIVCLCRNEAVVGYQHIGYNVGGIIGRSCGYTYSCTNTGEIYGRKDIGGIVGQAEPHMGILSQTDLVGNMAGQVNGLTYALSATVDDLSIAGANAAGQIVGIAAMLEPIAEGLWNVNPYDPDSIAAALENAAAALEGMSWSMEGISADVNWATDTLSQDLAAINSQLSTIGGAFRNLMNALTDRSNNEIIHDTSEENIEEITYGKVLSCNNQGTIYGDINAGGITGQVSVESDLNPEDDLELLGGTTRTEYEFKAVLTQCVNIGSVTSRKNCAGGISGKLTVGYVVDCENYGTVSSENGDYVGGIVGLCYSRIRHCWAKCNLTGERFVGGIVGSGYKEKSERSVVQDCRSMVILEDCTQFIGAVSGYNKGEFSNNLFVSDALQGINGLSVVGMAEPIGYENLLTVEEVPERFQSFILRFEADEDVLKTTTFRYGQTFSASVYPEIPQKDGYFATWEDQDLSALHADTTVHAVYIKCSTILASDLVRTSGRPALYVEGQFAEGARFTAAVLEPDEEASSLLHETWYRQIAGQFRDVFHGRQLDASVSQEQIERLNMHIPEDGAMTHTVRYTLPENRSNSGCRIYLHDANGYTKVAAEQLGKYYCFPVSGTDAEILVFSTVRTVWFMAVNLVGLVLLLVIVLLVRRARKKRRLAKLGEKIRTRVETRAESIPREKRKTLVITLVAGTVLLGMLAVGVSVSPLGERIRTLSELKKLLNTDMGACMLHVEGNFGEQSLDYSCIIDSQKLDDAAVNCVAMEGLTVYYTGGKVILPNGRAYRVDANLPDRAALVRIARQQLVGGKVSCVTTPDGVEYAITVAGERAGEIVRLLLPELEKIGAFEVNDLRIRLTAAAGKIRSLTVTGKGETHYGVAFSLRATLTPGAEHIEVSDAAVEAIRLGQTSDKTLSSSLLPLAAAWLQFEHAPYTAGTVSLKADCGSLILNDNLDYTRWKIGDTAISRLGKNSLSIYYTDTAACTSEGKKLTGNELSLVDTAKLLPALENLCLDGTVTVTETAAGQTFVLTVDGDSIRELCQTIAPGVTDMDIRYQSGKITVSVTDGRLTALQVNCGGVLKVVRTELPVSVSAGIQLNTEAKSTQRIPDAVRDTLIVPEA